MTFDVTVIIPTYCYDIRTVDWFEQAVNSAYNQANVVVYDDCSPYRDQVEQVVISKPGIVFVRGDKNKGVSFARNTAVAYAETELIFPLDCDDRLRAGAMEELLKVWKGVPLYPDVWKFNEEKHEAYHFQLISFDCEKVSNTIGISSVGVLHSVKQWKEVGGWDKDLNLFEDALYNAALMKRFCGSRYPQPLYEYRLHSNQKTSTYNSKEYKQYLNSVLKIIRSLPMACPGCGAKRRAGTDHLASMPTISQHGSLPGESAEGMVLAQYIGGVGKGPHYYKGHGTGYRYKVINNQVLYVDPRDTRTPEDTQNTAVLLVRIKGADDDPNVSEVQVSIEELDPAAAPPKKPEVGARPALFSQADVAKGSEQSETQVVETEVVETAEPDMSYKDSEYYDEELDPTNQTVMEIQEYDYESVDAEWMIAAEKANKNRQSVIDYLEGYL